MQDFDKRIEKLKNEKEKLSDKIKEYNDKISEIQKKIEELENQRIVTAFRSTGFSIEDVITRISALKLQTEKSEEKSDDEFEKEFAALEAEERKNNNEI